MNYGPRSQSMVCPRCNRSIRTRVKYRSNVSTHGLAILLLIFCWPCICLPYCCGSCKTANHYCPKCKEYLGSYGGD